MMTVPVRAANMSPMLVSTVPVTTTTIATTTTTTMIAKPIPMTGVSSKTLPMKAFPSRTLPSRMRLCFVPGRIYHNTGRRRIPANSTGMDTDPLSPSTTIFEGS